ncbi:hypothetical protein TNCV_2528581 [Trichonephila clavipes]|nr:hypothetical protein TNCV_2528581 [Trichonephila clavipes]
MESDDPSVELDRVLVYSANTPQVWGSINGLLKVDSAFHPRYIGSINEYQVCFGSQTLKVFLQTDHQIGTSVHAPQRPMVTCIMMGTVVPGPHWIVVPLSLSFKFEDYLTLGIPLDKHVFPLICK